MRRSGKTFRLLAHALLQASETPGHKHWIVFNDPVSRDSACDTLERICSAIPDFVTVSRNSSQVVVDCKNGSQIHLLTINQAKSNCRGYVVSRMDVDSSVYQNGGISLSASRDLAEIRWHVIRDQR